MASAPTIRTAATSNVIRMISWVPFLGRNGLLNATLLRIGLIHAPLEFLLFSDFAVVLAFVHLYTLFMVAPIFNTMVRIDHRLIEAATDAGIAPSYNVLDGFEGQLDGNSHRGGSGWRAIGLPWKQT